MTVDPSWTTVHNIKIDKHKHDRFFPAIGQCLKLKPMYEIIYTILWASFKYGAICLKPSVQSLVWYNSDPKFSFVAFLLSTKSSCTVYPM